MPKKQYNNDGDEAIKTATYAGRILLENGAEISRVEDTMERIATNYGIKEKSFFVLSNGIFTTSSHFANVEFIPFKGSQLDKVVEVNDLSRHIAQGNISPEQARKELDRIATMPAKPFWEQIAGAAIGSAGFCIIFGGGLVDSLVSLIAAALLYIFVLTIGAKHLPKIFCNICGGFLASYICLLCNKAGLGDNISNMIIGAIIPLIPGVPFTNGIRDIANEDYIAGTTRLLDALMVFFSIAIGVALALLLNGMIEGNITYIGTVGTSEITSLAVIQIVAAFLGTIGFAVLFGVPRKHYIACGVCAAIGWAAYLAMTRFAGSSVMVATLVSTFIVAITSQIMAMRRHCPVTVFLICGIFPLIPGAGLYWTSYYIVSDNLSAALSTGFLAIKIAIAIILGIIIVSQTASKIYKSNSKSKLKK